MKKYEYIFFDLDGTISDAGEGITNSVAHSLKSYGIEVQDKKELNVFVGPPLYASYMKYYGFSKDKALEAVERYREYYSVKGVFECELYVGVKALLEGLFSKGKKIVLATSKPEVFASEILRHFGIDKCFCYISGATLDSKRVEKADIINHAIKELKITDKSGIVMIGDREFDILGAKQTGIDSVGVTYGYGSRKELENAGADYICDTAEEIFKIIK